MGIERRDKVLPILGGLLNYLPHFQALSASSPSYEIGAIAAFAQALVEHFSRELDAGALDTGVPAVVPPGEQVARGTLRD